MSKNLNSKKLLMIVEKKGGDLRKYSYKQIRIAIAESIVVFLRNLQKDN